MNRFRTFLSIVSTLTLVVSLFAQNPSTPSTAQRLTLIENASAGNALRFDHWDDGSIGVRGATYKAFAAADGFTYVPFLGSQAPQNYPVKFVLEYARRGGLDLDVGVSKVSREGDTAHIERVSLTESYAFSTDGVEQFFRFDELPPSGELRLRMRIDSELAASQNASDIRFSTDLGEVRYSTAFVRLADGTKIEIATTLVDGGLEIVVPEGVIESAGLPLVIDPLLTTVTASGFATAAYKSDVAYEDIFNHFLVVWEETFSASDHDIYCQVFNSSAQALVASPIAIDFSTVNWTDPRVASNTTASQFMIVAARGVAGSATRAIWGRAVASAAPYATTSTFAVSNLNGECSNPDIGGDASPTGGTNYLVVFQHTVSATDRDIRANVVTTAAQSTGSSGFIIDFSFNDDINPAVSKSNGLPNSFGPQRWTVVWQRNFSAIDRDIRGLQLDVSGFQASNYFAVDNNLGLQQNPRVSSLTDGIQGQRPFMVAYEEIVGNTSIIRWKLMTSTTTLGTGNLANVEVGAGVNGNRYRPAVETDGCGFTIAYSEYQPNSLPEYDVYATTFHVNGGTTTASEAKVSIAATSSPEDQVAMTMPKILENNAGRTMFSWDRYGANTIVQAATYLAQAPGSSVFYWPTGTEGLGIGVLGEPVIGHAVGIVLQNSIGPSLIAISAPVMPVEYCLGQFLAIDVLGFYFTFPGPNLVGYVPCNGAFLGLTFAIQGFDLGGNICGNGLRLSDTAYITIH